MTGKYAHRMKRTPIVVLAAVVAAATLAACGPQTDERVAPATSQPAASAEATAVAGPYVTLDCATGAGQAAPEPPAGGTTVGDVTAVAGTAPTITVASDAAPVTDLQIADLVPGTGEAAQAGDTLTVDYCGVGLAGTSVFDSSWMSGQPATFPLDGLIAGWQQGLPGMKVGGTRLLVIPGSLAYGPDGSGPIGPDESLAFVIELTDVQHAGSAPAAS